PPRDCDPRPRRRNAVSAAPRRGALESGARGRVPARKEQRRRPASPNPPEVAGRNGTLTMAEDRLEEALDRMKQEAVDAATLEAVRARVLNNVTNAAAAGCAEFRPDLRAFLSGSLTDARRALLTDHISRCTACRAALAEIKGERRVIAMPQRSSSVWR